MEKAKVFSPANSTLVTILQDVNCVTGSIAINDEFHDLFVSINGKLIGPLSAGRYSLDPRFSPFFAKLRTFATGGQKPINVSIFYVSKKNYTLQWGTGEILCNEKVVGVPFPIRIAAGGTLIFKVLDSAYFLKCLVGLQGFDVSDLETSTQSLIIPEIRDAIVSRMSAMDFVNSQGDLSGISQNATTSVAHSLHEFGLSVSKFVVSCLNVNEEDRAKLQDFHEKRIAHATELEALSNEVSTLYGGDVRERARLEALLNFSKNPGSSSMANIALIPALWKMGGKLSEEFSNLVSARTPRSSTRECPNCHGTVNESYQFCPHCGHRFN